MGAKRPTYILVINRLGALRIQLRAFITLLRIPLVIAASEGLACCDLGAGVRQGCRGRSPAGSESELAGHGSDRSHRAKSGLQRRPTYKVPRIGPDLRIRGPRGKILRPGP